MYLQPVRTELIFSRRHVRKFLVTPGKSKKHSSFKSVAGNETVNFLTSFTYSAACTEVEVYVLIGVTQILRADIVYDVGEPPLALASSAFFAIKRAVVTPRVEQNLGCGPKLDCPATVQAIRETCEVSADQLTVEIGPAEQDACSTVE